MRTSVYYRERECRGPRLSTWLVAAWLGLLLSPHAFALNPATDILQYNCRTWNRQNGLPANGINAIAQTKDGYLWFGSAAGLVRFDGIDFKLLDLHSVANVPNSVVSSLAAARASGLWVGLENSSFGFYDGQSFSFHGATNPASARMNVRSILEGQDGTLWLAAPGLAGRMNRSGELESVLQFGSMTASSLDVTCGYEDRQGRLWFGTASQGVFCWQAGKTTKLPDPELEGTIVLCVTEDVDGKIWVGTVDGLRCYDASLQRQQIPLLWTPVRALLVDRQGVLWIGTSGLGLARFQQGTFVFLQSPDGLAGNYVQALAEDHEGSLWVGTRDGISQISDVKFPIQPATEDRSVKEAISVGASPRGGVWIASSGGVTRFDSRTKTYATQQGLPTPIAKRVFEASNGDLYVVNGTRDLVIFSGGILVARHAASNMVVGLVEDAQGVVVSVGGELYRAGTNYFRPYSFRNGENPPFHWILNLASGRDGVIWVACNNGVFSVKDGAYQHWSAAEGFSADTRVVSICEDQDGVVWAALLSGIARLKDNQVKLINRKHGLFDDNLYAIVPDDLGNLWVDSGRGIFRVSRQGLNDFAEGRTDQVNCVVFDGIESIKVADKSTQERVGCKTTDGRIWFPNPLGVVMIDPAQIPTNLIAPPVHIDRLLANGKEVGRSHRVVVQPGKGELEFHYNALSFIAPQKAHFRYRLEGYNKYWVDASDRRMAFFTNLKPGRYTFLVNAANADGVWNLQGDRLEIELLPHSYQTAWFYALVVGLTCAGLAGVYVWRVRLLKHNQQLLQAEVRNRTAELANTNTSLQHEIEERKSTEIQLKERTLSLEREIEERKRMGLEIERVHQQLLETSRQAGMAEVAIGVLHNVGNVLNSVNVASTLLFDRLKDSKIPYVSRTADLLREHTQDMARFMSNDPKGVCLPDYLAELGGHLTAEQDLALEELAGLHKNIEHIKEIVAMQQSYAKVSGVMQTVRIEELIEDALRMNEIGMIRHGVQLVRDHPGDLPAMIADKHKIMQILVNLVCNAKYACDEAPAGNAKRITARVRHATGRMLISVIDTGVGIPAENLTRVFNYGFTTRKNGHGFGLHSGALAAMEMGGSLTVQSDGPGQGTTFTLELPLDPATRATPEVINPASVFADIKTEP